MELVHHPMYVVVISSPYKLLEFIHARIHMYSLCTHVCMLTHICIYIEYISPSSCGSRRLACTLHMYRSLWCDVGRYGKRRTSWLVPPIVCCSLLPTRSYLLTTACFCFWLPQFSLPLVLTVLFSLLLVIGLPSLLRLSLVVLVSFGQGSLLIHSNPFPPHINKVISYWSVEVDADGWRQPDYRGSVGTVWYYLLIQLCCATIF